MTDTNGEDPRKKWRNRRWLAWASYIQFSGVGVWVTKYGLESEGHAAIVGAMSIHLSTLMGLWAAISLAYIGATTYAAVKGVK